MFRLKYFVLLPRRLDLYTSPSSALQLQPTSDHGVKPHFIDQYTKLLLWALDTSPEHIPSLVHLDSDVLDLSNLDEFFTLPHTVSAAPDIYLDARGFITSFNVGVMFKLLRADSRLYNKCTTAFPPQATRASGRVGSPSARSLLPQYRRDGDVRRLPYAYNDNIAGWY